MLPTELEKLRATIRNDRNQITIQKELLEELDKLDRFLTAIPAANSLQEVRTKMLNEGIEKRAFAAITSGPGSVCQCCGRNL